MAQEKGDPTNEAANKRAEAKAEGVVVKPHPAARASAVGWDDGEGGQKFYEGDRAPKKALDHFNKKENWHRPTVDYPEGFPLLVEVKEGE